MRAGPAAATMQAFLAAWLDELSWTDSLRLGAACRGAREALGADGVAAAAFAVTRPWRRTLPEDSLGLWRRAWGACASASSALGLHGGAWLKTGTVALANSSNALDCGPAVTLDSACAREVANRIIRMGLVVPPHPFQRIAILLISGKRADIASSHRQKAALIIVELQVLLLLSPLPLARPVFAAATILHPLPLVELAANPLDVCHTLIADGLDTRLLVPRRPLRPGPPPVVRRATVLPVTTLSSGMKRLARDGRACDLFDFVDWYRPWPLALQRWREAPPLAEVQDEREIALEGMLTRRSSRASAAASGAPPEPDEDTVPIDPNLLQQVFLEAEESIHAAGSEVEGQAAGSEVGQHRPPQEASEDGRTRPFSRGTSLWGGPEGPATHRVAQHLFCPPQHHPQ